MKITGDYIKANTTNLDKDDNTLTHPIFRCALAVPLAKCFDYLPPKTMALQEALTAPPGIRLKLPFGNQSLIGYLIEIIDIKASLVPRENLRPAHQALDNHPLWDPQLWRCLHWISQYYHYSLGNVLAASLPKKLRDGAPTSQETPGYITTSTGFSTLLESLKDCPKQQEALSLFREHPRGLSKAMLKGLNISPHSLQALRKKKLIEACILEPIQNKASASDQDDKNQLPIEREAPLSLNTEQANALNQIQVTCFKHSDPTFHCFLLDGITGSGKTEVYLQLIASLPTTHQTLVLVPEITLAPQTVRRFKQRFNMTIALYHSDLTDLQRLDTWRQAKTGQASIIIGTRSAAFLSFNHLGLIIVDEEHDPSFKQQDRFCYSARDIAVYRAQQHQIPIVLGSATPSLESLYNCTVKRYTHLTLRNRAGASTLPEIRLIDIRNQKLQHGLCERVLKKIQATLDAKQQTLIFINRRGFAPLMMCHACGHHFPCPNCDANLTVHQKFQMLKCHHCLHSLPLPSHCPQCNSNKLDSIGFGTERIESDLQSLFPDTQTIRIDRDNIRNQQHLKAQLSIIDSGQPLLLVGTQMISKGHHFPNVTFVCIMDADAGLFSIDFRASERLAQLTLQVAGRAGRAQLPGEVWLQTRQPNHPTFQLLLEKGYEAFAQTLLEERQQNAFPPFQPIALLRAESVDAQASKTFLSDALQSIHTLIEPLNTQATALGPVPAPMEKRAGFTRYQLLLQAPKRSQLHKLLDSLLPLIENHPLNRKVRWRLDVDPSELY